MVELLTVFVCAAVAEARVRAGRLVKQGELLVDVALGRLGTCGYGTNHSPSEWYWTPCLHTVCIREYSRGCCRSVIVALGEGRARSRDALGKLPFPVAWITSHVSIR
jgi:hypothetical protein